MRAVRARPLSWRMSSLRPIHALVVPLVPLLLGSDCAATEPCYPFEDGDQITVTLVEPYDEESVTRYRPGGIGDTGGVPSCEGFDGLVPGAELDIDIGPEVVSPGCEAYELSLASPEPALEEAMPGPFGIVGTVIGSDGCRGDWKLDLVADPDDPFASVVPGEAPPAIVRRQFETTDVDTCPMFPSDTGRFLCIDVYVATLEMR